MAFKIGDKVRLKRGLTSNSDGRITPDDVGVVVDMNDGDWRIGVDFGPDFSGHDCEGHAYSATSGWNVLKNELELVIKHNKTNQLELFE